MSAELPFETLVEKLGLALPEARKARESLRQLLHEGCDQAELGNLIVLLTVPSEISLAEDGKPRERRRNPSLAPAPKEIRTWRAERAKDRKIHLRPLDDWTSALGSYRRKDLIRLRRKLNKAADVLDGLADELQHTQHTALYRHLWIHGEIASAAALSDLAASMRRYAAEVLPAMIEGTKQVGPHKRPDRARLLRKLLHHVRQKTGREHYSEVSDILKFLCPRDPGFDADALKQWFHRQESR